ncbi:peptidylprolyl isomerase [Parasediminibacterium sp. JCM 36343]|uniref:foldase protein PrsA n=1 Tax=Parasediminibacterium sp. JCM 36343 TaxID=3374279 RepID=UPI00397B3EFD
MKHYLLLVGALLSANALLFSQTLFTYGNNTVSKQAFLTAFNKNPPKSTERRKALDEYLGLYINYKLKVQAGYDEQLEKQPSFEQESKNFRKQIADNIINEEVGIKALVDEAMARSQKDIHAAQVFVEIPKGGDTAKALQQIQAAYTALQAGKPFETVAATFSSDDATKKSKGDLGFITAFTLSYPIENEIYGLKPGSYSKPFKSSFGYHIFKNIGERAALGKRKIAQILIATPPGAGDAEKKKYLSLADSIYQLIVKGGSFEKLAAQYSNEYKTANVGGVVGDIGVGQYDAPYENKVFSIQKVDEVTKPFATEFGYHIIKLLEKKPVTKDITDAAALAAMKLQVEKDERLAISKKKLIAKWLVLTKYKPGVYDAQAFKTYTDSNLQGKITNGIKNISDTTVIFSFEKKKVRAADWAVYATKTLFQTALDYGPALKTFVENCCTEYYTENLEFYNQAMRDQCKEFDEANLLFAAMDKHVWGKAGEDVEGLKKYYSQHKEKYQWQPSVSALVVSCKTKESAAEVAAKIKQNPQEWHTLSNSYGGDANADSGRYELTQLPLKQPIENKAGYISTPEKNSNDDSYTFVYILETHPQKEQRSFDDAKGMVINDYQQVLEQQWIAILKKQYPVTVNQGTWKTVN